MQWKKKEKQKNSTAKIISKNIEVADLLNPYFSSVLTLKNINAIPIPNIVLMNPTMRNYQV